METKHTPGSWVIRDDFRQIGTVKEVYGSDPLIDVVLYAWDGSRIGRESPHCGGPRGFEPACPAQRWLPISRPHFPLPRYGSWGRLYIAKTTGQPE